MRPRLKPRRHAVKLPHYIVEAVKPLGTNPEITAYLVAKGVWPAAQQHLSEVYYYVEDEQKRRKHFCAAGWQNELGHWQVRSRHFKGSLCHEAITFISRSEQSLAVFEDFFDCLCWLTDNPGNTESMLVLNSPDLLEAAIRKAKDFLMIKIWFARGDPGRRRSETFIKALPQTVDGSAI